MRLAPRSAKRIGGCLVLAAAVLVAAAAQATAPDGSLAVVVIADQPDRRPLVAADVTLTPADESEGGDFEQSMVTGDEGTCVFERVPPGRYIVRAGTPGFVTTPFGATLNDRAPTPIVVSAGRRTTGIEVRLPAGGAVSGVVRGSRGTPAPHVTVMLMELVGDSRRVARISDAAALGAVVRAETDNDGGYRLHGLPGGSYLVQATRVESGATLTMSRGYYPGTIDPAGASVVFVEPGQDVPGIDIQMQSLPLIDVSGAVAWQAPQPRPNLKLLVFPDGLFANPSGEQDGRFVVASPDGMFSNPVSIGPDDTFAIRGVPPGQYELWLRSFPADALAPDDPGPAIWGHTRISVDSMPVSGVVITPHQSSNVSGRVDAGGQPLAGASIALMPTEPPGLRSRALRVPAAIAPDGTFRIVGVTPGRYRLEVSVPSAGWSMTSARANGRDLFETPFEIGPDESISDVVVGVAHARPAVTGVLLDRANQPVSGMRVVIFPAERRLWLNDGRRIRSTRTATDGSFSVSDLPAGDYRLGALATTLESARPDLAALEGLSPVSVPFTLGRDDRHVVNLRIAR